MSSKKASDRDQKISANPNAKSSIVHKPFATGTINIFNPHRSKAGTKPSPPKLFLNAELEQDLEKQKAELALLESEPTSDEIEYQDKSWIDNLLSPWGISAIAILFAINLISAGFIWRNARNKVVSSEEKAPVTKIGNNNFSEQEFIPLNLSTLGTIETLNEAEIDTISDVVTPIPPALAPLDNIAGLSSYNTSHHYVLSTYRGEESLSLAQEKVEQVSLVNFPQGIFIYMGAFKNREDAEKFVDQLIQEDFSAHVYPLD